jgi:hypothetical protein
VLAIAVLGNSSIFFLCNVTDTVSPAASAFSLRPNSLLGGVLLISAIMGLKKTQKYRGKK